MEASSANANMNLSDEARFQADLEFLQLLSNPEYLHHLANGGYFEDPKFINYLLYLQYWKQPQYAKYIIYPVSLGMLDALINSKQLRDDLKFVDTMEWLLCHWMSGPVYDDALVSSEKSATTENSSVISGI